MSFFEDASLVYIPAAIKNGKTYSIKPTDGTGDLTFTRASSATRVGPNGYIEKVRTNLFKYSEQFNQGSTWSLQAGATISANAGTAPDGTTTADLLYPSVSAVIVAAIQVITTTNGVEYGQSVYVKAAGKNYAALYTLNGGSGTAMWVNLTTGAITNGSGANVTGRFATDAGNGWWRIGFTDLGNGSSGYMHVYPTDSDSVVTVTPNGTDGILVWGAQMETGVPTEYIKTEAAAVSVGPVSGTPRLDYLGSDCGRLLLEPQRSNLLPMSEQMNNATFWNSISGALTITPNVTISPDGYQNADSITLSNTTNRYFVSAPISLTAGQVYTYSVYMKSASGTLDIFMSGVNGLTGQMKSVTTEWQRFTLTFTMHANGSEYFGIDQRASGSSTSGTLYFWGAQVELGAYATSYIQTLGTAVTRVADGSGTGDVFGKTFTLSGDFGLYWEGVINGTLVYPNFYSGGNYAAGPDYRSYLVYNGNTFQLFGVNEVLTAQRTVAISLGTLVKILVKRVGSTIKWYINGTEYANTLGATTTTVTIRSLFGFTLGAPNHESVAKALIFETTLSDAQAIELTTL